MAANPTTRYGLRGRVVSMDASRTILSDGIAWVADGSITGVTAASDRPPGHAESPVIATAGTIYPGMIELHNHLPYNTLPLVKVPRQYTRREEWQGTVAYRRYVSGPAGVIASAPDLIRATIRYVECKSLIAGTTTSQGLTLRSVPIKHLYPGMVRKAELPGAPGLEPARAKIGDVTPDGLDAFRKSLAGRGARLLHLAVGLPTSAARQHFLDLQAPDGTWAIAPTFVGIHAIGLTGDDLAIVAQHGGSIVWSPFSNLILYGATKDIATAMRLGIKVALGSDWSPTGSKNLLNELKVAQILSRDRRLGLTDQQLVEMVTVTPAQILGWQGLLGSIEPGKLADLTVVAGRTGDPYSHLIDATEGDIRLVVIGGTGRYGTPALLRRLSPVDEQFDVAGQRRAFHLDTKDPDPVLGPIGLGEVAATLADALEHMPERAKAVGSADLGLVANESVAGATSTSIAVPLKLDPLATQGDDAFFVTLANLANLPEVIRAELPGRYPQVPRSPSGGNGRSDDDVSAQVGPVTADYSADTFDRAVLVEGDTDTLGIRGDVDVLSSVIASRRIHPPLSLGIFGAWGAGKSFMMNQLRLRVTQLAQSARSVPEHDETESYYCSEIVQIGFNAWQYAGGELWASLINRVFEGIRDHLGSDKEYRQVIDEIERQDETVRNAARRLAEAEQEVRQAVSPAARRTVAQVEADNPEIAEAASSFTKNLGLNKDDVDLIDVAVRTRELYTLAGRLREGWSRQGRRGRVVLLSALAIGIVLLGAATALPSVASALAVVAGVLTPVLAISASILKPAGDALRAGLRILGAGDQEKQKYAESKAEYEAAREELERLRRQGPGGLYGFVEDRYRAEDYRKALGMVSLIRADLRRLEAFTTSQPGVPNIERVVLYIDDLDRCPSEQVVRVLEAVNLLFGFPLFVVVIAVDSRWLIRSLEENFRGVFGAGQTPAPTPQDYLEKVIQIPFWLQQMGESGFGRLVSTLAQPPARKGRGYAGRSIPTPVGTPSQEEEEEEEEEEESVEPTSPAAVTATPAEILEADARGDVASPGPKEDTPSSALPAPEANKSAPSEVPKIDPRPQTLVITDPELGFLRKLAPLVDTPRSAKRLLNTYQLIRVSVEDVPQFLERSLYEPLLVLLALVTSSPGLTAPMVRTLLDSREPDLPSFLKNLDAAGDVGSRGWMRLRDDLSQCPIGSVTPGEIRKWLPIVSRFSFQPGLAQLSVPDAASHRQR